MNMNSISGVYRNNASILSSNTQNKRVEDIKNNENKSKNSDKVSISTQATKQYETRKVSDTVSAEVNNTDNSAKIALIKEQIANNTYNVDANAVAEKILARFSVGS